MIGGNRSVKRMAWHSLIGAAFVTGLYLSSWQSYLLFHSLTELFIVVVAVGIFVMAWHTRKMSGSSYLLLLGTAYLSVGVIQFAHALSYGGMGVFPASTANLSTQLWIQARYFEAFSLLLAPLLARKRIHSSVPLVGYAFATLSLLWITFATDLFPVCYVEGEGLTPFKRISEYIVCVLLLLAVALHYLQREHLDRDFLRPVLGSIALTVLAELAFTRYLSVYGSANLVGHLLTVGSFFLLYRGVVVTGLVKPYHAMRESEALSTAMLDSLAEHVAVLDSEGYIRRVNRAWRHFAIANDAPAAVREGVGLNYLDVCRNAAESGDNGAAEIMVELRGILDGRRELLNRLYDCHGRGEMRWFRAQAVALEGSHGGLVVSHRNVTAEIEAEKEKHRLQQELTHIARVTTMGQLAAAIAHEVNQPLAAMVSNAQAGRRFLNREEPDNAEATAAFQDIAADGLRAGEVIRRVRAMTSKSGACIEPIDINAAIEQALALLHSELVFHNVSLNRDLAEDLPAVLADRVQVQQVLLNLIKNAVEAMDSMDERCEERSITVRSQLKEEWVQVVVSDCGAGFEELQEHSLFEPFVTSKPDGLGMGLVICQSIIQTHGGSIWAEANPEGGATFRFTVPVSRAAQ